MLPIYKEGVRYVTGSFVRTKQQATIVGILLVCCLLVGLYATKLLFFASSPATTANDESSFDADDTKDHITRGFLSRTASPLLIGFCLGFIGSVPIAGPTSALVLKLGIQQKYWPGRAVAVGGALAESTYAGLAYWGFGSFLAGLEFLLPASKVLGAVVLLGIGTYFLRFSPKMKQEPGTGKKKRSKIDRNMFLKNLLMGATISGINPALFASYTGAITTVYSTGWLEFTFFLSLVFALGVASGISTWFFILIALLEKYKKRLKSRTIRKIMRGMGLFLILLGIGCAKSSFNYFFRTE